MPRRIRKLRIQLLEDDKAGQVQIWALREGSDSWGDVPMRPSSGVVALAQCSVPVEISFDPPGGAPIAVAEPFVDDGTNADPFSRK